MAYPPVPIQIDSTPLYMTEQQQHRLAFVKWSLRAGYAQFSEQIDNNLVQLAREEKGQPASPLVSEPYSTALGKGRLL